MAECVQLIDAIPGHRSGRSQRSRTDDVWEIVGRLDPSKRPQHVKAELGRAMRRLGFERGRSRLGERSRRPVYYRGEGLDTLPVYTILARDKATNRPVEIGEHPFEPAG